MQKEEENLSTNLTPQELFAIGITCGISWLFTYLSIFYFINYAWGLFIWLPLVLGAATTMISGYKKSVKRRKLRNVSFLTLFIYCCGLLGFAWEGLICLIMAAPITIFFTWAGHRIGYILIKKKFSSTPAAVIIMFLSVPALLAFENEYKTNNDLRSITTSIEIYATPEEVWKNVIKFSPLTEPTEFIFKTGIAYPTSATISGEGKGAIRSCNFSTGCFVEPITIWDKPKLLKFNVEKQPAPMKELSFYDIHPNHLHGFWISKEGQFKLTQLENGNTVLEGTTWYINKIKPDFYWTLWSDYIVHKIHQRVLNHIKIETEKKNL